MCDAADPVVNSLGWILQSIDGRCSFPAFPASIFSNSGVSLTKEGREDSSTPPLCNFPSYMGIKLWKSCNPGIKLPSVGNGFWAEGNIGYICDPRVCGPQAPAPYLNFLKSLKQIVN